MCSGTLVSLLIQVGHTALLAVANTITGVTLYQYNGWRFMPTALQQYAGPLGPGVTFLTAINWNDAVLLGKYHETGGQMS